MGEGSKIWKNLTQNIFSRIDDDFIQNFRMPGAANQFAAWDPYEKSTRYFKFLLYATAQERSDIYLESYRKIQNLDLGKPLSIQYADCAINADYLAAVEEWEFLENSIKISHGGINNIVEIGAGFGRTCHTLLSLCPHIDVYTIVDLDPMLALSSAYLKKVIPEKFDRIRFVSSEDLELQSAISADLAINIDSFQEMHLNVIDGYMNRIIKNSELFYCKNPIGKYLPESIGLPGLSPEKILDVFELGRCRNTLDIFNDSELRHSREAYLKAYRPAGEDWSLLNHIPMLMFSYYHHVLYSRR